jgi:hypothetical protein
MSCTKIIICKIMMDLSNSDRWMIGIDSGGYLNFCVWTLIQDGLKIPPFDCHPEGSRELRNLGLNSENWWVWFKRIMISFDQRIYWHISDIPNHTENTQSRFDIMRTEAKMLNPNLIPKNIPNNWLLDIQDAAVWQEQQYQEAKALLGDIPPRRDYSNPSELWLGDPKIKEALDRLWSVYLARKKDSTPHRNNILPAIPAPGEEFKPLPSDRTKAMYKTLRGLENCPDRLEIYRMAYPYALEFSILPSYIIVSYENGALNDDSFCESIISATKKMIEMKNLHD